jgi:hypothetical protein
MPMLAASVWYDVYEWVIIRGAIVILVLRIGSLFVAISGGASHDPQVPIDQTGCSGSNTSRVNPS